MKAKMYTIFSNGNPIMDVKEQELGVNLAYHKKHMVNVTFSEVKDES